MEALNRIVYGPGSSRVIGKGAIWRGSSKVSRQPLDSLAFDGVQATITYPEVKQ